MSNRNAYIDILRGSAILLVVIGHAIQSSIVGFDEIWLFKAIYSFHMPMFMFISGLTVYRANRDISFCWLTNKFKQLIIPFCIWMIVPRMFTHDWNTFPEYCNKVFWGPDNA